MSRFFPLTRQAYALELHRWWARLLAFSLVVIGVWGAWALTDRVVVHEHSDRVHVGGRVHRRTVTTPRGGAVDVNVVRERRIVAEFPAAAGVRLQPGQAAVVRVGADAVEGTVTDVDVDERTARAVLYAWVVDGDADPFERGDPARVDIAVGTASPLGFLAAGPAAVDEPSGKPAPASGSAK